MKRLQLILIFAIFLPLNIFSQERISEITEYTWNQETERWDFYARDKWDYNKASQEILHFHEDVEFTDFNIYDQTSKRTIYNDQGKILQEEFISLGVDLIWSKSIKDYRYNAENKLEEYEVTTSNSGNSYVYRSKSVFEKDEAENRSSQIRYRKNDGSDHWILVYEADSFFNDNGCLYKSTTADFYEDGTRYNYRWRLKTYTSDCQLLSSDYLKWSEDQNMLIPINRYSYEYLNNGKIEIDTFKSFDSDLLEWNLFHILEKEYDDEDREIRSIKESFYNGNTDTTLVLTTYTSKGDIYTSHRYATANSNINTTPLMLVRLDSFTYQYNDEDNLIFFESFYYNNTNSVYYYHTQYEYYCNGLLKEEIAGRDAPTFRRKYTYHGGVNCPLEKENQSLVLFPNPSDGCVTIHSDFLVNADATIQIFTVLGKEIFSEKVNQATYLYTLNLPLHLKGQYIVTVSNEKERISELLMVY